MMTNRLSETKKFNLKTSINAINLNHFNEGHIEIPAGSTIIVEESLPDSSEYVILAYRGPNLDSLKNVIGASIPKGIFENKDYDYKSKPKSRLVIESPLNAIDITDLPFKVELTEGISDVIYASKGFCVIEVIDTPLPSQREQMTKRKVLVNINDIYPTLELPQPYVHVRMYMASGDKVCMVLNMLMYHYLKYSISQGDVIEFTRHDNDEGFNCKAIVTSNIMTVSSYETNSTKLDELMSDDQLECIKRNGFVFVDGKLIV